MRETLQKQEPIERQNKEKEEKKRQGVKGKLKIKSLKKINLKD